MSSNTSTSGFNLTDRFIKIGGKTIALKFKGSSYRSARKGMPIHQFDSRDGKASWFYFFNDDQVRQLLTSSETMRFAEWDGPGWYRTVLKRLDGHKFLILRKGDLMAAMKKRFYFAQSELSRLSAFVAKHQGDQEES